MPRNVTPIEIHIGISFGGWGKALNHAIYQILKGKWVAKAWELVLLVASGLVGKLICGGGWGGAGHS